MSEVKVLKFPDRKEKPKRAYQRADGRIARHFRYTDVDGTQRRKTIYGKTNKEAEQKKRDFLNHVEMGLRVNEQQKTVAEWAEEWLRIYKQNTVAPRTLRCYQNDIKHLIKALGTKKLRTITQADIVDAYNARKGASYSALRQYAVTTNAIFRDAQVNRLIPFNPAAQVKPPVGEKGTHRALTKEEIAIVLQVASEGHQFALPVMLMLFAGLRKGEMAAIDMRRDIADGCIHVREGVTWATNQPEIGKTKTPAAVRSIPIMPQLKPYLNMEMRKLSDTAIRRGIASFSHACAVKLNGCTKRWQPKGHVWKDFTIRCHDLRHTFATMLYDAGVDIKTAQRWLGHTDPALTMRIYTHLSQEREQSSTEQALAYFSGGNFGGQTTEE